MSDTVWSEALMRPQGAYLLAAGFLARYDGATRTAYALDLRAYSEWSCAPRDRPGRGDPAHGRAVRALDARGSALRQGSTAARRLSTVSGLYRFAVIDGVLAANPAASVRRPQRSEGSHNARAVTPATGGDAGPQPGHLKYRDHALIVLLGLLGLRVGEACAADIEDLGMEHGHRVRSCTARAARTS